VFLTKFAKHVTIFIRKDDFSCAASVADKAKNHKKITVVPNTVVEEVSGDNGLNYIRYKNTKTGEITEYRAENGDFFGVFVFAGYSPETSANSPRLCCSAIHAFQTGAVMRYGRTQHLTNVRSFYGNHRPSNFMCIAIYPRQPATPCHKRMTVAINYCFAFFYHLVTLYHTLHLWMIKSRSGQFAILCQNNKPNSRYLCELFDSDLL
jgi:hypothetical protein